VVPNRAVEVERNTNKGRCRLILGEEEREMFKLNVIKYE
jgi:hypothetical protein